MHAKTEPTSAGQLTRAKQCFDRWRQTRKRRTRIPGRLWRLAAEAASIHGVNATARELRLNPAKLKEQMHALGPSQGPQETLAFVEFPWMGAAPVPECILEAEDHAGRKLRIHLKGSATTQAAALGWMLWESQE